MKDNNNLLIVVGVAIVVAIIVSVVTTSITGNVVSVYGRTNQRGIYSMQSVYNITEVDNLIGKLYVKGGVCMYWDKNNGWHDVDMCGVHTDKANNCQFKSNNGNVNCIECRYNNSTRTAECLKAPQGK